MDVDPARLDWSLMAAFLAVAEEGSLSAAARKMGASQPTLGRQVRALEAALGAELFRRVARGLEPTALGLSLMAPARAMREAMGAVALTAAGRDRRMAGTVRITASEMFCTHRLPPVLARLRQAEPGIELELAPSDVSSNLLYREADIALRMYRPRQQGLVIRHLGEVPLVFFAARSYAQRRGLPERIEDLAGHDFVGFDKNDEMIEGFRAVGLPAERDWFGTRCDDQPALWALVRAGCGIGVGQAALGRADPELIELPIALPVPPLPVWITAHEAMRHTPRIARIWELLVAHLRPLLAEG